MGTSAANERPRMADSNHAQRIFDLAERIKQNQAESQLCIRELELCGFSIALVLMSETPDAEPLRAAARVVAKAAELLP